MIIHLTHLLHLWRGPEYVGVLFPDEVDMLNLASLERAQVKEVKIDGRSSWEVVRGLLLFVANQPRRKFSNL